MVSLSKSLPREGVDGLRKQPQTKERQKTAQPPPQGHIQVPGWCQLSWDWERLRSRSKSCWPEREQGRSEGRERAGENLCRGAAPQPGHGLLPALHLPGRAKPQLRKPETSSLSRAKCSFLWKAETKAVGRAWLHHPSYSPSPGWQKSPAPSAKSFWPGMSQKAHFKSFSRGTGRT